MIISKSEFASHIGVTRSRITALLKKGLPVEGGGKINVDEAEAWIRRNLVPQARFDDRGVSRVVGGPRPVEVRPRPKTTER